MGHKSLVVSMTTLCYNRCNRKVGKIVAIKYKDGYAYVDGYKFRKDTKTGYYLSTKKIGVSRLRLHVYVWKKHNGDIPKGYQIHHKDQNKDNNEIENLDCLSEKEHLSWHGLNPTEEFRKKRAENFEKVRRKATEWHKSKEGLEWHKKQGEKLRGLDFNTYAELTCHHCGIIFQGIERHSKYCTPNCRTKARKASGVDDETRECEVCNDNFTVNKYSKKRTCSRKCAGKLQSNTKKS